MRNICEEFDADFELFGDACSKLSPYATATRYPTRADITVEEADYAIEKAKEIYEFVHSLIPELDEGLKL